MDYELLWITHFTHSHTQSGSDAFPREEGVIVSTGVVQFMFSRLLVDVTPSATQTSTPPHQGVDN